MEQAYAGVVASTVRVRVSSLVFIETNVGGRKLNSLVT